MIFPYICVHNFKYKYMSELQQWINSYLIKWGLVHDSANIWDKPGRIAASNSDNCRYRLHLPLYLPRIILSVLLKTKTSGTT